MSDDQRKTATEWNFNLREMPGLQRIGEFYCEGEAINQLKNVIAEFISASSVLFEDPETSSG